MPDKLDISFEDLYVVCEKCGGSGHLEERVSSGGGLGQKLVARNGMCDKCNGRGGTLTSSGEAVLKFVQKLRNHGFDL